MSTAELRKRKGSEKDRKGKAETDDSKASSSAPAGAGVMDIVAKVVAQAGPLISMGQKAFALIFPYIIIAYDKYKEISVYLAPYRVDLLFPAFVGFILCFFGGTFFSLIAAAEAYRQMGYSQSINALNDLKEDWEVSRLSWQKTFTIVSITNFYLTSFLLHLISHIHSFSWMKIRKMMMIIISKLKRNRILHTSFSFS